MAPAEQPLKYTQISRETFNAILSHYSSIVPEKLRELDVLRYETIPAAVISRAKEGGAELTKDEVVKLVEWKLKHGTFRPTLLSLVQANPAPSIANTTRTAFSSSPSSPNTTAQLKPLTSLRGIGPATASLLLSVAYPSTHPFFSDELYRWLAWDAPSSGGSGGRGWKRGIKYNVKEYAEVVERFGELRGRLGVRGVDAERVAWVLGRRGVDLNEDGEVWVKELGDEGAVENRDAAESNENRKKAKTGVKRKAGGTEAPVEGVRRSSRRKAAP
ncbi:uncharacterized protein CC84DRAFT_1089392 [Paraphaeosphaeria sporulosa]|uniref:Uncharacterized protein n=1 Tax=Paraphaeosphaeria sporulosa TaxID=1460663 RepID=A0A177CKU3_9PLEO|nr:uncharacterized protein CC84DRAFT_1089392 [Paraphaeosphaeria sporulosa]OAG07470.1 hypothetical protein CC84DRAFT_1089392 [Paraphaeosphaeria sporulosa]